MISTYSVSDEGEYYMSNEFEAHSTGGINCLILIGENTLISGGDRDRKVIAWDISSEFEQLEEMKLPESMGSVRTIVPLKASSSKVSDISLYVGTTKNNIAEGVLTKKFTTVVWGHNGELFVIAPHPDELSFVTAGSDRTVAKWKKHKVVWKLTVQSECRSAAYHPSGAVVVIGTGDGHILALNNTNGNHITTIRVCGSPLTAVPFNHYGDTIAAAAHNGSIYFYKVSRDGYTYKKFGKMSQGPTGYKQCDWSHDGEYLQTVSTDNNLNFWNTKTNKMEKFPMSLRDVKWLDQTCIVGFPIAGTWNNVNYKDDSDITSVHMGNNRQLVVAGDNHGYVRLFRSPCTTPKAEFNEEKPSSKIVHQVKFLMDDLYVISASGKDATLVRWKIK